MKRKMVIIMMCILPICMSAQSLNRDSISAKVGKLYESFLPLLDRVEFTGNSSVSQDLRDRWNNVVRQLNANKSSMPQDVMDLLVSPSGKPIDLELLMNFIQVTEEDSIKKVNFNMDFILDEIKKAAEKVTNAAVKMAETKK